MNTVSRETLYKAAVEELEQYLHACPHTNMYLYLVNTAIEGQTWDELIELQRSDEDYQKLIQLLDKTVEKFSHKIWPLCMRARAYWPLNRYTASIEDLDHALRLDKASLFAISLLGETYFLLDQYDVAISYLRIAVTHNPTFGRGHYGLALCHELKGDSLTVREHKGVAYTNAIKHINAAINCLPTRHDIYEASIRINQKLRRL